MNYELAKQLKEAGFPQKGNRDYPVFWFLPSGALFLDSHETAPEGSVYVPNLEELIEACGKGFYNVSKESPNKWRAIYTGEFSGETTHQGKGSTPTEAVALLWISLNKN